MDLINVSELASDAKLMRAELIAARMAIKSLQQQAAFERRRVDLLTIEFNQLRARLDDGAEKNPDL